MEPQKNHNKFDALDSAIRAWLQSEDVFKLIVKLNEESGAFISSELSVIPQALVNIATGDLKPENFAAELSRGLPFIDEKTLKKTAETIKQRVFKPLALGLKKYGIDTNAISTTVPSVEQQKAPTARETKVEGSLTQPLGKPVSQSSVSQQKPSGWQATPPPSDTKARVMPFVPMNDIKKPSQAPVNPPTVSQPKPKEPDVVATPKPFGLSETVPQAPSEQPVSQSSVSQQKPEPPKPQPKSEPHELTEYHDEHPMKES